MVRSLLVNVFVNNVQNVMQKRVINWRKKAAVKKELIKNTPFAEDADKPFIPSIDPIFNQQEPSTIVDNEVEFFPTDPHPFRTGTIIEENGFLFKEREMDGLIFYDSLQVLDDSNKTLDNISDSNQYRTACLEAPPIISNITHLMDSGCSPGTIVFVDTFSDTDYLNDLSLFHPTENEYWNDWLLDEPTRRLMTQGTIDKCNQYNINANDLSSVMNPLKPRMTRPTDIDYESKRKYFANLPAYIVNPTFKRTPQNMRLPPSSYLHKMFKSPKPSAYLKQCDKANPTDLIYSDILINGGEKCAHLFVGKKSKLTDAYKAHGNSSAEFLKCLQDRVRYRGCPTGC
jgi:hypothetical protein